MTAPMIPSALQGVLTPLAPSASTVPSAPASAPDDKRKVASPFYLRYLNDQATAIRLRARELGEDEDAAVNQFLDLEERQPLALLPGSAEATQAEVDATNKPAYLQGVSRAVLQGATFGFGDEALGALYGLISPDITSAEGIAQYRREYESWARENRKTAIGAEFAGALGATLLTAGAAGAATPGILRMSATAGAAGAVSGAGHAQGDIDDRLWGALLGSATGFAGGVVLGGAGRYAVAPLVRAAASSPAGQKLGGAVESAVKRVTAHELVSVTPEARMRELLTKTLLAEGITYDKALRAVDDLERAGVKASILAVGGDAVRDLVGSAAKMRSPFTTKFLEDLKRSEAQVGPDMVHALLEKGVAPQRLGLAYAYDLKDALERQALAASKLPYEAAFKQVVDVTPSIARRLQHPQLRKAWDRVTAKLRDDDTVGRGHGLAPMALPDAGATRVVGTVQSAFPGVVSRKTAPVPFPKQLPVRHIDEMKRELDAMVEEAFPPIQNAAKDVVSKQNKRKAEYRKTLFALYDDVVKETVAQVPVYGKALSAYGGPMEVRDLVQLGEKAWRMKGQDIARKLARVEPNKREFVRIGYARAAYEAMIAPGKSPRNVAERFFGGRTLGENSLRAEQIRALFPEDPLKAAEFLRLSAGQARVTEATGGVLRLARQVVTEQKKDIVEGAPVPIRGQLGLTIASGAERVAQRFRASLTQEEADELTYLAAKGLSNPADLRALLNDLFYTYAGTHVKRSVRKPLTRALGEVAGSLPSKAF